jgi:glycogen debranching enzyme
MSVMQPGGPGVADFGIIGAKHTRSTSIVGAMVIRENDITLVTLANGDIPIVNNYVYGLYYHDCRFLNGYILKINGEPLTETLSSDQKDYTSTIMLTNQDFRDNDGHMVDKETLGVWRNRSILPGCIVERIQLENYNTFDIALDLSLELCSDFEDIFTIRGITKGPDGQFFPARFDNGTLYLSYQGLDGHLRTTMIEFDPLPSTVEKGLCTFSVRLGHHGTVKFTIKIFIDDKPAGKATITSPAVNVGDEMKRIEESYRRMGKRSMDFFTDNNIFNSILLRSMSDARMLHTSMHDDIFHAGGVPWYDALFGRDSIISAIQMMPYHAYAAQGTLKLLARYQGTVTDDWRDEDPGKVLHELRRGEKANQNAIPQTPYYGTVDATPLFLVLLAEYVDWTGDLDLLGELIDSVDAAMDWIDNYSGLTGSGFASYTMRSPLGLYNQGWKDSLNAIMHADGTLAEHPVALAEVQGYVYMAKKRMSAIFNKTGSKDHSNRLEKEAEELKRRFNERFWMDDKRFFAQALDAKGKCDVISSNPAQCLWSGIVDRRLARTMVDRLFEPDMYTGWGIRTLSSNELLYNPLGYHIGTVWPHDNSLIAMGMCKYGFYDEFTTLFSNMYDAASVYPLYRLPELFGGLDRGQHNMPVKYPVACSPQAWSAGTIPYMLNASLGLVPDALNRRLTLIKPHLPPWLGKLRIDRLNVGDASVRLEFQRVEGGTLVNVLEKQGDLRVDIEY